MDKLKLKDFPHLVRSLEGQILVETTNENLTIIVEKINDIIVELNRLSHSIYDLLLHRSE